MRSNPFSESVKRNFRYLMDEYGFRVTSEGYSPRTMGNSALVLESARVGVEIVLDRGRVIIALGPRAQPKGTWYEFTEAVRHFAPEIGEDYFRPHDDPDQRARVEAQVARLAGLMRCYCGPMLRGDFSMWERTRKSTAAAWSG
ncbi:MAG: hypothetical protein HYZ11_11455 [Candidatus Tectomicrobia bacterium]|uniref:Uncharacterized protein n=1 Tax=Tectimicrobiota bacterium TaxID=2528274 RepID=A0A932HZL7_UNCTE|nr:hypothetical protein [Candidatus Tectomicrobia bacterium]